MEYELDENGEVRVDEAGNPIPKQTVSSGVPENTVVATATPAGTDPARDALFFNVIRDKENELRVAREEAARLREQVNKPPVRSPEERRDEFFNDPETNIQRLVNDAVDRHVAPLNSFVAAQVKRDTISTYCTQIRGMTQYAAIFPKIESFFVNNMMALPQVNDQVAAHVLNALVGQALTGQLPGVTLDAPSAPVNNQPPATAPVNNTITPPHMAPSRPASTPPASNAQPELNENERRLCRELKLDPATYIKERDMNAQEFTASLKAAK